MQLNILKKMNKITTTIIIILIFYSCNSYNQDDGDILSSKDLIAYVENPSQRGINNLLEGQIVIMDIASKKKYYIKENKNYFNNPVWAKKEKTLIYFSEASNDKIRESLRKMIISKDICVFDIQSKSEQLLFPNLEKIEQRFYLMMNKIESTNDSKIFIVPQIETIYQINSKTYVIKKILELDSVYHITNIDLSPDGKFLMLNVHNNSIKNIKKDFELLCYSIDDSLLNRISTCYISSNGGWDIQSENYIYTDWENILNFNVITNSIDTLSIPVKNPSNIAYTKDGNIIGLTKKVEGNFKPDEVFLYNQKDKKIIWLTNDNIYKECLSILF
jgi:hypothetical protein